MQPTVLIVEDDPISLMFLRRSLRERTAYDILSASDGETAVSLAHERSIAVLLTDLGLPGIDGVETARRITARQDTRVIVVTGFTDDAMMARLKQLSPFAIRSKPVNIEQIIDLVNQAVPQQPSETSGVLAPDFLLDTLYDTAEIGMCVTDENRCFVRVNRAYCNTYGYSRETLMGREFTTVLPEEDRELGKRMHDDFIAGKRSEIPQDWRVQRHDGAIRNIFVTAGRMIGTDGRPYKVTTVSDVTDRRRNEIELERALEEKKLLIREVSHRVKNSLNTLTSIVLMQQEHLPPQGESHDVLNAIANRIRAIGSVYQQLQQSESASQMNVREYLTNLAHDISESLRDTNGTSMQVEVDDVTVDVDTAIILGLVVNELITNSLKHGGQGAETLAVTVSVRYEHEVFAIDVSNTGSGLSKGFDPRQRTSLGMQLMQAMSGQRGGDISVVDEKSAHFRVTIPHRALGRRQ